MLEAVFITPDDSSGSRLVVLAHARGFRAESFRSIELAESRIVRSKINIIFSDSTFPWQQHLRLSRLLWETDPASRYVVISINKHSKPNTIKLRECGIRLESDLNVNKVVIRDLESILCGGNERTEPTILVIESLETPLKLLENLITHLNYPTVGTLSGEEGWQLLNDASYNWCMVITEIKTKDLPGNELIRLIRSSSKLRGLPAIVLSAHGTAPILWDCLIAGATGFLVKPPRRELVISEIGRARRAEAGLEEVRLVQPEDAENVKALMIEHGHLLPNG